MSTDQSPEALIRQGEACLASDQPGEAIALFEQALRLRPQDSAAWRGLGKAQLDLGDLHSARQSFTKALAIVPYDRYSAHMLAALSEDTEKHATGYVSDLFDAYADQFDTHLTDTLGYRLPEAITALLANRARFDAMLDLGCGTGLVGAALSQMVRAMDGIDIAPRMTRRAHDRGIYRHLSTGDTLEMLSTDSALAGPYDLVTAADVFVYVGTLEATFTAIERILAPNGIFIFSIENAEGSDVTLRSSGRHAHSGPYIQRLAAEHGLAIIEQQQHAIRLERSKPIPGTLYLLTRAESTL